MVSIAALLVATTISACGDGGGHDNEACAHYVGIATAKMIGHSPLPNEEAEILAIEASGQPVAPLDVYDRIARDLSSIRSSHPEVQGITARPTWPASDLFIGFDAEGSAAVTSGTYADWECPNELYGAVSVRQVITGFFNVEYAHRFNVPALSAEYAKLPHVITAGPDLFLGDGNDVCASFAGTTYSYIFDAGSGDCPAGCIEHVYSGFSTPEPGQVVTLGTWSKGDGDPPPWFAALAECEKWL